MNVKSKKTAIALAILGLTTTVAQAALHDRGNGLIYDDVLDVTWLSDPNYITQSGFAPSYFGLIHWETAMQFAEQLEYGGFNDWRLPRFTYLDSNADGTPDCRVAQVRYCDSGNHFSELQFMFEINLGNQPPVTMEAVNNSYTDGTTGETKYIRNLKEGWLPQSNVDMFWHETEFIAPGLTEPRAWTYDFGNSVITHLRSEDNIPGWGVHAWLLRDGDVLPSRDKYDAQVEGGSNHTMVLKDNGELWGWGSNYLGQLGNGTTIDLRTPKLISSDNDYKAISASHEHTLALNKDGTVVGWGYNRDGKLGVSTSGTHKTPVTLALTNITQVEAGYRHGMALDASNNVWVWGDNHFGQLANSTGQDSKVPTKLTSISDVTFIDSGEYASFVIKSNGTVWSWGRNDFAQLGRVTQNNDAHIPAQIHNLDSVNMIAAGTNHALALKEDGTVWGWGFNSSYQTGHFDRNNATTEPTQVTGLPEITSIAAGYNYSIALAADGSVWVWGGNSWGQLGLGYTNSFETAPVKVPNLEKVVSIEAHWGTSIFLTESGNVAANGSNFTSAVGNGSTSNVVTPVIVLTDVIN